MSKRIYTHDLRSVLRGGEIPSEKPYSPDSVNGKNKLVRMDTCRRSPLCGGKPEEWESESAPGESLSSVGWNEEEAVIIR